MSGRWLAENKGVFARDLLRDYCHVSATLEEQHTRFEGTGTISHAVLRDLLGEAMRKGVFWRLKDTAHHLFRTPSSGSLEAKSLAGLQDAGGVADVGEPNLCVADVALWQFSSGKTPDGMVQQGAVEAMLDWIIGFAFHECVKLKEDAFQRQHYANRLIQMRGHVGACEDMLTRLFPLTEQTSESMGREIRRIRQVLDLGRALLIRYLGRHGDNGHVARFLVAEETLARKVFGVQYAELLTEMYGAEAWGLRLPLLAARAYLEGGRPLQALELLEKAAEENEELAQLREWAGQFENAGTAG